MLNNLVKIVGFKGTNDFVGSLLHVHLLKVVIPVSVISAFVETYFGLKALTLIAFVSLLTIELCSGVYASRIRKIKISSQKFNRFLFKLFIWLVCFFIINAFRLQHEAGTVYYFLWDWLHGIIMMYVSIEYLISVLENLAVISGKSHSSLIHNLRRKLNLILEIPDKDDKDSK